MGKPKEEEKEENMNPIPNLNFTDHVTHGNCSLFSLINFFSKH